MPVNSFESYPMSWKPDKSKLSRPLYLSIANWLVQDILSGKLPSHTKLPPQRELADYLDIDLSTVTRAYKHCALKGLIYATIGRGTFVAPRANAPVSIISAEPYTGIELGIIQPFYSLNEEIINFTQSLLKRRDAHALFEYSNPLGTSLHQEAARYWLNLYHTDFCPEHVAVASGAQNAIAVVLAALFSPGDYIAVDSYTYPNFTEAAKLMHIQLIPVPGDEHGMLPQELIAACEQHSIKGLYIMPTCSNPTTTYMPIERRQAIAAAAKAHMLRIMEDEAYPFLSGNKTIPISAMAEEQSVYIASLSKALSAGLRIAFLAYPNRFASAIERSIFSLNLKTCSLNAEIAADMICSGKAEQMITKKLQLAAARNSTFNEIFSLPGGNTFFRWLPMPETHKTINGYALEEYAKQQGIHIYHSSRFAVGAEAGAQALRIAITSPSSLQELRNGLLRLKEILLNQVPTGLEFMV